jgi:hypothetical protein
MSRGAGRGIVEIDGIVPVSGTVTAIDSNQALVLYESGTMLYVCKAAIGTALNAASWQIKRVDTSSGVVIKWAGGNDSYDNLATDLATVAGQSYS